MIVGICDDDARECEKVKEFICDRKFFQEETKYLCLSPQKAKDMFQPDRLEQKVDIMIMDIEFSGYDFDGIALTGQLNQVLPDCQIIYLTHILDFAPYVYDTRHCYFVLKNQMEFMLENALKKAYRCYQQEQAKKPLRILCNGSTLLLKQNDIYYIEKADRKSKIVTKQGIYFCGKSLTALQKELGTDFERCHGSFLVNLNYVVISENAKLLVNEKEIDEGRTYRQRFRQRYTDFCMDRM